MEADRLDPPVEGAIRLLDELEQRLSAGECTLWRVGKDGVALDLGYGQGRSQVFHNQLEQFDENVVGVLEFGLGEKRGEAADVGQD